jgi:hypothetical protein
MPRPELTHLDPFPKAFENYYNANFELKPSMVFANSFLKAKLLSTSSNPERALIGKDHWLFFGGHYIDDYTGVKIYSDAELKKIKTEMHRRAMYARAKNSEAKLYLVPIPNKHTIYPEKLPFSATKIREFTKTDQVISLFQNDTLVKIIDIRGDLLNHKKERTLYYQTDNHWNNFGSYIGYKKIITTIQKDFPTIKPEDMDDYNIDSSKVLVGGEAQLLNAGEIFHEPKFTCKRKTKPAAREGIRMHYPAPPDFEYSYDYEIPLQTLNPQMPVALIIRDSFTDFNIRLFAENFNRSYFIFDAWKYKAHFNMIDDQKPKVVLYMIVENNLDRLLDNE